MSFLADLIFWPLDGGQTIASEPGHLLAAIAGGVMAGFGVLLYLLATHLYPKEPDLARLLISASIGVWFLVDSLGSIAAGAPLNAVLNIGFLALFLIPLWLPSDSTAIGAERGAGAKL
ncbi:MAG: excinuclease ABC subunit A [Rhizobiales bacterium]|nr:excinuclease ABC subunit A [Hyphomicrobiales bacterium]